MIDKNKKYTLRMGGEFHMYEICDGYIFGKYKSTPEEEWILAMWNINGTFLTQGASRLDLIEAPPYANLKIDDRVLVSDYNTSEKLKMYFAGVNHNGQAMAWHNGATSFSSDRMQVWNFCEPYTETEPNT